MLLFDIKTLFLGLIQGLCEFLPISSSGHLALAQNFFNLQSEGLLAFDLLLHCATMLAVLIYFAKDIKQLLSQWFFGFFRAPARTETGWKYGWFILAATLITACIGLPMKEVVELAMTSPLAVGAGLLATAVTLSIVPLLHHKERGIFLGAALFIGLCQGIAVFPGISRSGATIAAGLFMGLAAEEAFRFSFLLSIPAITGASLLEMLKIWKNASFAVLPDGWVWAVLVAFLSGWGALILLRKLVISRRWAYFGIYCFALGLLSILSSVAGLF